MPQYFVPRCKSKSPFVNINLMAICKITIFLSKLEKKNILIRALVEVCFDESLLKGQMYSAVLLASLEKILLCRIAHHHQTNRIQST